MSNYALKRQYSTDKGSSIGTSAVLTDTERMRADSLTYFLKFVERYCARCGDQVCLRLLAYCLHRIQGLSGVQYVALQRSRATRILSYILTKSGGMRSDGAKLSLSEHVSLTATQASAMSATPRDVPFPIDELVDLDRSVFAEILLPVIYSLVLSSDMTGLGSLISRVDMGTLSPACVSLCALALGQEAVVGLQVTSGAVYEALMSVSEILTNSGAAMHVTLGVFSCKLVKAAYQAQPLVFSRSVIEGYDLAFRVSESLVNFGVTLHGADDYASVSAAVELIGFRECVQFRRDSQNGLASSETVRDALVAFMGQRKWLLGSVNTKYPNSTGQTSGGGSSSSLTGASWLSLSGLRGFLEHVLFKVALSGAHNDYHGLVIQECLGRLGGERYLKSISRPSGGRIGAVPSGVGSVQTGVGSIQAGVGSVPTITTDSNSAPYAKHVTLLTTYLTTSYKSSSQRATEESPSVKLLSRLCALLTTVGSEFKPTSTRSASSRVAGVYSSEPSAAASGVFSDESDDLACPSNTVPFTVTCLTELFSRTKVPVALDHAYAASLLTVTTVAALCISNFGASCVKSVMSEIRTLAQQAKASSQGRAGASDLSVGSMSDWDSASSVDRSSVNSLDPSQLGVLLFAMVDAFLWCATSVTSVQGQGEKVAQPCILTSQTMTPGEWNELALIAVESQQFDRARRLKDLAVFADPDIEFELPCYSDLPQTSGGAGADDGLEGDGNGAGTSADDSVDYGDSFSHAGSQEGEESELFAVQKLLDAGQHQVAFVYATSRNHLGLAAKAALRMCNWESLSHVAALAQRSELGQPLSSKIRRVFSDDCPPLRLASTPESSPQTLSGTVRSGMAGKNTAGSLELRSARSPIVSPNSKARQSHGSFNQPIAYQTNQSAPSSNQLASSSAQLSTSSSALSSSSSALSSSSLSGISGTQLALVRQLCGFWQHSKQAASSTSHGFDDPATGRNQSFLNGPSLTSQASGLRGTTVSLLLGGKFANSTDMWEFVANRMEIGPMSYELRSDLISVVRLVSQELPQSTGPTRTLLYLLLAAVRARRTVCSSLVDLLVNSESDDPILVAQVRCKYAKLQSIVSSGSHQKGLEYIHPHTLITREPRWTNSDSSDGSSLQAKRELAVALVSLSDLRYRLKLGLVLPREAIRSFRSILRLCTAGSPSGSKVFGYESGSSVFGYESGSRHDSQLDSLREKTQGKVYWDFAHYLDSRLVVALANSGAADRMDALDGDPLSLTQGGAGSDQGSSDSLQSTKVWNLPALASETVSCYMHCIARNRKAMYCLSRVLQIYRLTSSVLVQVNPRTLIELEMTSHVSLVSEGKNSKSAQNLSKAAQEPSKSVQDPSKSAQNSLLSSNTPVNVQLQSFVTHAFVSHASAIKVDSWFPLVSLLLPYISLSGKDFDKCVYQVVSNAFSKYPRQLGWSVVAMCFSRYPHKRKIGDDMIAAASLNSDYPNFKKLMSTLKLVMECLIAIGKAPMKGGKLTELKDGNRLLAIPSADLSLLAVPTLEQLHSLSGPSRQSLGHASASSFPVSASHSTSTSSDLRIVGFDPSVTVMDSRAKPKRIRVVCSDGKKRAFLLKSELKCDMRKDSRVMEFLAFVNSLLVPKSAATSSVSGQVFSSSASNQSASLASLATSDQVKLRTYAVNCLSEDCALIEWVSNLRSLRSIFEDRLALHGLQMSAYLHRTTMEKLQGPAAVSNFIKLQDEMPSLLKPWFIDAFASAEEYTAAIRRFTRTQAAWSAVGYVLGLGDRHTENLLIDVSSGDLVHVDFDCILAKGMLLKVPEVVPFRLTRNCIEAMGHDALSVGGEYRRTFVRVMAALRKNRTILASVLQSFIADPLIDWLPDSASTRSSTGQSAAATAAAGTDKASAKGREAIAVVLAKLCGAVVVGSSTETEQTLMSSILQKENSCTLNVPQSSAAAQKGSKLTRQASRVDPAAFEHEPLLLIQEDAKSSIGRDRGAVLSIEGQVEQLVKAATCNRNLSQMYLGWMPFV